ncbi:bis(5'-nucleosyl)-tetraphosphatase (symmetrical) YqeK [bacterium]|nr:bis(5'-nucleosyl)-tetraphosphatase (symmetrical) YqeK [bacterium]
MNYIKLSLEETNKWLKENLNEKRYQHSLGTAECAKELAKHFGQNEEKAYIAGLLHDCAKCFSDEKLLEIIDKYLDDVDSDERSNKKTLHAPGSYYIAKTVFGLEDAEMLSAIRWHTLGKINMTDFEKIIFLADKIELRTRSEDYRKKITKDLYSENGLNKAILECYKETIKSLADRNLIICPLTIEIYNNLQKSINVN